jgi:mRNA interferase RelE/StbE
MSHRVKFRTDALKEWCNLDKSVQVQFANKLKHSVNPSNCMQNIHSYHSIKLKPSGFKLAYEILSGEIVISAIAIGKREHSEVFNLMSHRIR